MRTNSGAVAVQVARKDAGRVVILAHLGSAHTDAELGILLEQAKAIVIGGQVALDFEVAARGQSMTEVADFRERALIAAQPRACGSGRSGGAGAHGRDQFASAVRRARSGL